MARQAALAQTVGIGRAQSCAGPVGVGIDSRQANSPIVRLAQEGPRRRVDLSASLLGASLSTPRRLPGAPLLGASDAGFLQGYVDFTSFLGDLVGPPARLPRVGTGEGGNKPSDPITCADRCSASEADKRRLDSDINDLLGGFLAGYGVLAHCDLLEPARCLQT